MKNATTGEPYFKVHTKEVLYNIDVSCSKFDDNDYNPTKILPWLWYAGVCCLYAFIAGVITTYYGQGATGSGVAEFIGYLNGINYPDFLSIPTFITKIVGVTLAVCGKLAIGKEGPLCHIGAMCGSMIPYFPLIDFRFL